MPTTAEQKELERIGLGEYFFKYSKIFILGLQVLHNLLKIKFQSKFWIYSGFCIKVGHNGLLIDLWKQCDNSFEFLGSIKIYCCLPYCDILNCDICCQKGVAVKYHNPLNSPNMHGKTGLRYCNYR